VHFSRRLTAAAPSQAKWEVLHITFCAFTGFPVTSPQARKLFYLYSNWLYQAGACTVPGIHVSLTEAGSTCSRIVLQQCVHHPRA
jgi:hypothetical protein